MAIGQSAQTLNTNWLILNQRNNGVTYGMCMDNQVNLGQLIERTLTQ